MKAIITLSLGLLLSAAGCAQQPSFQALRSQASTAYAAKNYPESGRRYEQAFQIKGAKPAAGDFYNAACSWALAGDATQAFRNLERATAAGWTNVTHLKTDSDLATLHADARWQPMLNQLHVRVAAAAAKLNQPLKKELEEIYAADQGVRQGVSLVMAKYGNHSPQMDSLGREMQRIDAQNLPRVTAMIDQYGWPGQSLVGHEGSVTAFLVIQHSNLATMQKYVPLMRAAAAKGELDNGSLALVEDRILTFQHKPQIYGSQLQSNPQTGKLEFLPIADEAHVDERRAKMGLNPIAEYAQGFGLDYKPRKK